MVFSQVEPTNGPVVVVGTTLQLVCKVNSGDQPISMSWIGPAAAVLSADVAESTSITTSITFSTSLDYGNYTCTANNSFGVATDIENVIEAGKHIMHEICDFYYTCFNMLYFGSTAQCDAGYRSSFIPPSNCRR